MKDCLQYVGLDFKISGNPVFKTPSRYIYFVFYRNTSDIFCEHIPHLLHKTCNSEVLRYHIDCKTVRIYGVFKNAGAVKQKVCNGTENGVPDWVGETLNIRFFSLVSHALRGPYGLVRLGSFASVRLLRHALPISLPDFEKKKTDRFQSSCNSNGKVCCTCKDGFLLIRLGY